MRCRYVCRYVLHYDVDADTVPAYPYLPHLLPATTVLHQIAARGSPPMDGRVRRFLDALPAFLLSPHLHRGFVFCRRSCVTILRRCGLLSIYRSAACTIPHLRGYTLILCLVLPHTCHRVLRLHRRFYVSPPAFYHCLPAFLPVCLPAVSFCGSVLFCGLPPVLLRLPFCRSFLRSLFRWILTAPIFLPAGSGYHLPPHLRFSWITVLHRYCTARHLPVAAQHTSGYCGFTCVTALRCIYLRMLLPRHRFCITDTVLPPLTCRLPAFFFPAVLPFVL